MPHPLLPRLGCLALAMSCAAGVELPITAIAIGPEGAVVERAGTLPPGDEVVDGLPLGLDPNRLSLVIAGLDSPPALRLVLPVPAREELADPAWQQRLAAAQEAFDAAQPLIDLAEQRKRLARAVLALLPESVTARGAGPVAGDPGAGGARPEPMLSRPETAATPVTGGRELQALLQFVTDNATRAEDESAAARRARLQVRATLIALDQERERAHPPRRQSAQLPLPGAGGRAVRLRYTIDRASWAPVYRIEVADGRAELVREALIDVPRDQDWNQGELTLVTRTPGSGLTLKELQVPVLELSDEVVTERSGGGKQRAIARGGGSLASESYVNTALRQAQKRIGEDGSWPAGAWTAHATALRTLVFLGAGYDHRTPNRYRHVVDAALSWLCHHETAGDIAGQALTALALAEAWAMTGDAAVKPSAERALAHLTDLACRGPDLELALYHRGAMAGPQLLGWVTLAWKSALAGNLDSALTTQLGAEIARLLPELDGHANRDEAGVTRLLVEIFLGRQRSGQGHQPPVSEWLEHATRWFQDGRPELAYFATLGMFQSGGDAWVKWNGTMRDKLVELQDVGLRNGWAAATPSPLGEDAAMALLALPLEVYYRYSRIDVTDGPGNRLFGNRMPTMRMPDLPPLPDLASAARSWPVSFAAGPAHLVAGQRMRILLGRTPLPGRLSLHANPADGSGAWRVLRTTNPLGTPLLAGALEVVVDHERLGTAALPFTEPGRPLNLELGRDERVLVTRSEERSDDEAWGKRTRTFRVHLRVDAPPGLYQTIRIDEAMPVPANPSIQLVSVDPAIAPDVLDRRLVEEPVWHLDLDLATPPARGQLSWQLRYPATLRPAVEQVVPAVPDAVGAGVENQSAIDSDVEEQTERKAP